MRNSLPLLTLLLVLGGCQAAQRAVDAAAGTTAGTAAARTAGVVETIAVEWNTTAGRYSSSSLVGRRYTYICPPDGAYEVRNTIVLGTNPYTDYSSVCVAGVHAGVISAEGGGRVTFEMQPGRSSYDAGSRNGVVAHEAGPASSSFLILP